MSKKAIWHSDESQKPGTVRIVCDVTQTQPAVFHIEQRIKDNSLGGETWMMLSQEQLPTWVTGFVSEFAEKIIEGDK